jgi:hypothetical protein
MYRKEVASFQDRGICFSEMGFNPGFWNDWGAFLSGFLGVGV